MTATINASTSSGVIVTSDTSGSLAIQSNGTAVATVASTGTTLTGTTTITTLSDGTNSTSATNPIKGSAKAWVNFSSGASAATINGSYNVSSVTRNGTGDYTITFTTAMSNANYSIVASAGNNSASGFFCLVNFNQANTTTTARVNCTSFNGSGSDVGINSVAVFSS